MANRALFLNYSIYISMSGCLLFNDWLESSFQLFIIGELLIKQHYKFRGIYKNCFSHVFLLSKLRILIRTTRNSELPDVNNGRLK